MIFSLLKTCLLVSCFGLSSVNNVSSDFSDHQIINNRIDNPKYKNDYINQYVIFDYANYSTTAHNYVDYLGYNGSIGTVTYNCVIYDYDGNKYDTAFLIYEPGYSIIITLYLNYINGFTYSNSYQIRCNQFSDHLLKIETLNYVSDSIDDSYIIGGIDFNKMFTDYFVGYNSFTFSDKINRFAPLCLYDNAPFVTVDESERIRLNLGNGTTTYPGGSPRTYCIFDGFFECEGALYNKIYIAYYWVNGQHVFMNSNSNVDTLITSFNNVGFHELYYLNDHTNKVVEVYKEEYAPHVDSDGDVIYTVDKGYASWLSLGYKNINIFYSNDTSSNLDNRLINYYHLPTNQRLNMFNENIYNWGNTGANVYIPFNNIFTLINMSINGISGFLGIQLLPGVTMGVLLLIPFAFTILLFVVKMFKR